MARSKKNHEIIGIGAGPVGLWTAIQAKKRAPGSDILLYEKYETYQRSHILRLEHLSTLLYSKVRDDPLEMNFYKDVIGKSVREAFQRAAIGVTTIRTNDLEDALKTYAEALGIKTVHERIDHPQHVMDAHPNCRHFFAADGRPSAMRTALLGEDSIPDMPLQHVAEVKYQSGGQPKPLGFLGDHYKANKLLNHMVFEYVGREKEGVTPVTLRFFLNKETYGQMPTATFKDPLRMNDRRLPASFRSDLATYMNIRRDFAGDRYLEESAKISKLVLSMYAAKKFAVMAQDRGWFFVGDAAMGVPYFRALNSGFLVGSQLAYIATRDWLSVGNKVRAYNAVRPFDIAWEFAAARTKDSVLKMYDQFRQASAKAPWEVAKWDEEQVERFRSPPQGDTRPAARQSQRPEI